MSATVRNIRRILIYFVAYLFLMNSCITEEFDTEKLDESIEFTPGVALPIGYIHYRLDEMLNDSTKPEMLCIDDDGFLTLRYYHEVTSRRLADVYNLPDVNESFPVINTLPILDLSVIPDSIIIQNSIRLDIFPDDTTGSRLDSIWIESLELTIDISTEYDLNGSISITSTSILDDGNPLSLAMPFNVSYSDQMDGTTLVLSNNQLIINYKAKIQPSNDIIPQNGTIFELNLSLVNADYSAIFGNLGQIGFSMKNQTVPIYFYNSSNDGVFHFEDPKLKLYFNNSYGIPIQVAMSQLNIETRDQGTIPITQGIPTIAHPIIINYPDIEQVGETTTDSIILDRTNTELFYAVEKAPLEIDYGIDGLINPPGEDSINFFTKDSEFRARVELFLPLFGYADFLIMMDTIRFEFNDFYDKPPEEIKRLAFRLNFTNGFPVNVISQLYFLDENYIILDSLFDDLNDNRRFITAGEDNDGDGKVEPSDNDPMEIEFTQDKIQNISGSMFIFIYGRINTTNYESKENVRFYSDYFFDAYIGVVADLEVNSTDY